MEETKEIYLGQKGSIARYNIDSKEVVWSSKVLGTPSLISSYEDYLIIQGLNKWGIKTIQHCLDASTGKLLWHTEEFNCIVVPHFLEGSIYFLDSKCQICKVSLQKGTVHFRKKFAGFFNRYSYLLAVSGNDVFLLSKDRSLVVNKELGTASEIKELAGFSKEKITAACGNNLDQISNITSHITAQANSSGPIMAGD
tara:strand:+ start:1718 stop:2308 length:591 start_codon:yes stop_codon:yes gene_type:complete